MRCPGPLGSCSPVCPLGVLCWLCGVLGHLAPVHRCDRLANRVACAVFWATWLLFGVVLAWCVVLRVRCPGPLDSSSPMCPLGVFCWVSAVVGQLAPVLRYACPVRCVACAVSLTPCLLFTGVPAQCVVLRVRCPGTLGSCSQLCSLGGLCYCAVFWATWLLFTCVLARCVVFRLRRSRPLGACSPVCPLGVLCWMCGVLGYLAPVHQCARSVCCVTCAVSWATWLLFTDVPARTVVLGVRCPRPLGSCSPMCPLGTLFCECGVPGHFTPVHRCARSV